MAHDSRTTESIFDFIYVDRRRVASHFAQLFPEGTLTSVKTAVQDGDTSRQDLRLSLGMVKSDIQNAQIGSEMLERQYDAAWTLPITLANRLDELGFLHRDLATAPLGQMVLLKGNVQIIDIRMLQNMWDPLARFMAPEKPKGQNRHQRRGNVKAPQQKLPEGVEFNDTIAELMRLVPHALQLNFCTGEEFVWSTLDAEMMTTAADDFALKHGTIVPGEWHMIAVIDRRPEHVESDHATESWAKFQALANVGAGLTRGVMDLLDNLRGVIGRPGLAYGATPLMIFRELRPAK